MSNEKPNAPVHVTQVEEPTGPRDVAWIRRADDVDRLVRSLGRMPRAGDEGVDSTLLRWIRRQQWARRQDQQHPPEDHRPRLTRWREERLNATPGWSWGPRVDRWHAQADKLEYFVAQTGHLPSATRTDATGEERKLAYWIANERKKPPTRFTTEQIERIMDLLVLSEKRSADSTG